MAARSSEGGMALLVAIFMMLITTAVGTSMMGIATTETLSTVNYRTASQARYAAESGVATAVNYLLYTYTPPATGSATDPLAAYDITVSPVVDVAGGNPVVLSSDPDVASNYPYNVVDAAFTAATEGTLGVGNGVSAYTTRATLVSMREFTNAVTGLTQTLQTWEITGVGTRPGLGAAEVEISATIEQPLVPIFSYAAFGTGTGCDILNFSGGGTTGSYDSSLGASPPAVDDSGGNVGTNGNLAVLGNPTTINGTLSTPRAGVGNCTENNVTAVTISGNGSVTDGLVELPQEVDYEDPEPISPTPPTTNDTYNSDTTLDPGASGGEITLGNVSVTSNSTLSLMAGTYNLNSLQLTGNSTLEVLSGPVIINVEGDGVATPIDLTGGAISNDTYVSSNLQFIYGGAGTVRLNGGAEASALIYAPNATVDLAGNANFYGAIIGGTVEVSGGAALIYDRALGSTVFKPGNISLTSFNWESF